jgi:chromosome segregation ATPase
MDPDAIQRARERLERAAEARTEPAEVEAALERARTQIEALAQAATALEATLPETVSDAVHEGLRRELGPATRQLAEVRGLLNQVVRRLERLEGDQLAERHARVDDLALLVDLISSGWRSVDERLTQMDERLEGAGGAIVYRIEDRQSG